MIMITMQHHHNCRLSNSIHHNDGNMIKKIYRANKRSVNDNLLLISNTIGCSLLLLLALILLCTSLFVSFSANNLVEASEIKTDTANEQDFEELGLHYGKYLKEVVAALDKDQKFTETIKNMDANDIKSGKVADQLKHVHEDVRKKLNDLKYLEIKRLRDLATRKNEMEQYGETYHGSDKRKWRTLGASLSQLPEHLGSHGTYFDVNDLHKLMVAATNDLEKLDKERREDFKTYEMEKEWQFQERLKMMNETEKQEAIKLRDQLKEKHDNHPRVHEPGSRSQFEEVWEKKDNLPKEEFDPKTFFALHDTNSDNSWDPQEVRALLVTEIQKLYDANNPEDDPNEMEEEFERMREHIYKEIDTDRDGLIGLQEFLVYSKKPEFKTDHGWEDASKNPAYSRNDYEDYQKNRERMIKGMHGHYDPAYYANQPNNLHLPDWGYGMPGGVNPAQYYGYHVDPAHPQAQQILAQQQMAYHQQAAAYQQHAAGYQQQQQPGVVPQQQQVGYQQPQANQQYYQQPAAPQANQFQQKPAQQVGYQQQPQQVPQQVAYQQPQQVPQQAAPVQNAAPQQVPQQANYQQPQQQVPQQAAPIQQAPAQQAQQQAGYQQPQQAPQQVPQQPAPVHNVPPQQAQNNFQQRPAQR